MIERKQITVPARYVVCDRCGAKSSAVPYADDGVAFETAAAEGFVEIDDEDVCPKCQAKERQ